MAYARYRPILAAPSGPTAPAAPLVRGMGKRGLPRALRSLPLPRSSGGSSAKRPDCEDRKEFSEGFACPVTADPKCSQQPASVSPQVLGQSQSLGETRPKAPRLGSNSGQQQASQRQAGSLRATALAILRSEEGRTQADATFSANVYSTASRATKESKEKTLRMFAEALGGELLPLQSQTLRTIFGAMRLAGYASAETYVSAARIAHISAGHSLGEDLKLFLRCAERALVRGRGPCAKAATFDICRVAAAGRFADWWSQSEVGRGPQLAWVSLVVGVWWMLRTIELVSLRLSSVRFHTSPRRAELRLGMTKTDIQGVGKSRVYECACLVSGGDLLAEVCPVCVLDRVVEARREEGAEDFELFFADAQWGQCAPDAVAACWNLIVAEFVTDDLGQATHRILTKHSARRAGAQLLTRRGRPLAEVQYMGRWGGQTVERYVAEAAAMLTSQSAKLQSPDILGNQPALWELQDQVAKLRDSLKDVSAIKEAVSKLHDPLTRPLRLSPQLLDHLLEDTEGKCEPAMLPPFVINMDTDTVHKCDWVRRSFLYEREAWVTRCGFPFGSSNFTLVESAPKCGRCRRQRCFGSKVASIQSKCIPADTAQKVDSSCSSSG